MVQQTWNNRVNNMSFVEILVRIGPLYIALYPINATTPCLHTRLYKVRTLNQRRPISSPLRESAEYQPNSTSLMPEGAIGITGGISHVPPITFPTFPVHEPSRNNVPGVLQLVSSPAATVTSSHSSRDRAKVPPLFHPLHAPAEHQNALMLTPPQSR